MQTWPPQREQAAARAAAHGVVRPVAPQRRVEQRWRLHGGSVEAGAHGGVQRQRGRAVERGGEVDAGVPRADDDITVPFDVVDVVVRAAVTGRRQDSTHGGAQQSHAGR